MFDALQRMNLTGHGIYEYRGPRGGTQVDLAVWADMVARIAGTVKGGEHSMDEDGRFFLHTPDGPIKVGSPPAGDRGRVHHNAARHQGRHQVQTLRDRHIVLAGHGARRAFGAGGPESRRGLHNLGAGQPASGPPFKA